jgi:SulP family sulfate permease
VFLGVILSILLFVYRAGLQTHFLQLISLGDGKFREIAAPEELESDSVTVLQFYGTTFFGAAYTLEKNLPSPLKAERAVVVLRLRGHVGIASTFVGVLERYAGRLQETGGKLILSGLSQEVWQRFLDMETDEIIPEENIFMAGDILGTSTYKAVEAAARWLEGTKTDQPESEDAPEAAD